VIKCPYNDEKLLNGLTMMRSD